LLVGIKKEELEKILNTEHYYSKGINKERGSGLGISICKRFIERHDSELELESTENEGATFKFKLSRKVLLISFPVNQCPKSTFARGSVKTLHQKRFWSLIPLPF